MICVDSSVWISLLRNDPTAPVSLLKHLVSNQDDRIVVGDLILLEILQGACDDSHAARIERNLRLYPVIPMLGEDLAIRAAANYRTLRSRGITVRKTIDLIIGTFCIANNYVLLHDDRDFDPMTSHLGLRTLTF